MKQKWTEFLIDNGAEITAGEIESYGNPSRELKLARNGDIITDLSHTGLISVRGEDAETFLQGQFTNDLRNVTDEQAQINGYCSPKGRLLSNFLIFRRFDSYYLRLPKPLVDDTIKRLKMFVLMSKVIIDDASDSQIHIGYAGPNAESELKDQLGNIPTDDLATLQLDDVTVIRLPGSHPRFEILGPLDKITQLWAALNVRAAPVSSTAWTWLTIQNGLPIITENNVDAFVPQMVNMHLINGVSFKKGCYTGQEIVARMQYLGKLKRRMYLAHVESSQAPVDGDPLFSENSTSGQGTGKIVNSCAAADGGFDLLAVIEIKSVDSGTIHLTGSDGPVLQFMDLPYPLEIE